jgi:hypothetical protein
MYVGSGEKKSRSYKDGGKDRASHGTTSQKEQKPKDSDPNVILHLRSVCFRSSILLRLLMKSLFFCPPK